MTIRNRILVGFLSLVAMLITAGGFSIYEFSRIGRSVSELLENNYKSIEASRNLLEALEREDSGILLLIMGNWEQGRNIIQEGDSMFRVNFDIVQNNITESNEANYIARIDSTYRSFQKLWQKPIVETQREGNIGWYFEEVHTGFTFVKDAVKDLMSLNQRMMFLEANLLREQAHRAIMPGIIAVISAFVFSLLFNFFISRQVIAPIRKIQEKIKIQFRSSEIRENNEIKNLNNAVDDLLKSVKHNGYD